MGINVARFSLRDFGLSRLERDYLKITTIPLKSQYENVMELAGCPPWTVISGQTADGQKLLLAVNGAPTTTMRLMVIGTLAVSCGRTRHRQIANGFGRSRRACRSVRMTEATRPRVRMR